MKQFHIVSVFATDKNIINQPKVLIENGQYYLIFSRKGHFDFSINEETMLGFLKVKFLLFLNFEMINTNLLFTTLEEKLKAPSGPEQMRVTDIWDTLPGNMHIDLRFRSTSQRRAIDFNFVNFLKSLNAFFDCDNIHVVLRLCLEKILHLYCVCNVNNQFDINLFQLDLRAIIAHQVIHTIFSEKLFRTSIINPLKFT